MVDRRGARIARYIVALIVVAVYLIPMLYVLTVSLTPNGESTIALPSRPAFGNYPAAIAASQFWQLLLNSGIVTVVTAAAHVVLSCMAGYALAKLPIKIGGFLLTVLIGLLIVPPEIVMVPLFILLNHAPLQGGNNILGHGGQGILDTYAALMLPHLGSALAIFLMRQFYIDLPDELGQAARVDGASEMRIFVRVYTPLTLPAIGVVAILAFQEAWNDFLWPLIVVRSNQLRTLQLGLSIFYQSDTTQWNLLLAAVLLMSLPVLAIFFFAQRLFTEGVVAGAVK